MIKEVTEKDKLPRSKYIGLTEEQKQIMKDTLVQCAYEDQKNDFIFCYWDDQSNAVCLELKRPIQRVFYSDAVRKSERQINEEKKKVRQEKKRLKKEKDALKRTRKRRKSRVHNM